MKGLQGQVTIFLLASLLAGIAPLFGFSAIAAGYVGYVSSHFQTERCLSQLSGHGFCSVRETCVRAYWGVW